MHRRRLIALSAIAMLAASQAAAATAPSLIDQLNGEGASSLFERRPGLKQFSTSGSPERRTYATTASETAAAIARLRTMMADEATGWRDVLEFRVSTRTTADQAEAASVIAADPALAGVAVTYRLVETLPATRARVALDAVAERRR